MAKSLTDERMNSIMNATINQAIVQSIVGYCKENVPSIHNPDDYIARYNEMNDLVVEFQSDKIAILYCSTMHHAYTLHGNPLNFPQKELYQIQQEYIDKGIRPIFLFDDRLEIGLEHLAKFEKSDRVEMFDLFKTEDGRTMLIYPTESCPFEFFKFKDQFEIVDTDMNLVIMKKLVKLVNHCVLSTLSP